MISGSFRTARENRSCAIHIVPAVSPVYFNNPAVEIGWYDKSNGELRDYAPLYLDLGNPKPTWATEYIFTQAYGRPRPNLAALEELSREIHEGNPNSGVGKQYANYYGAGVSLFLTPDNWLNYSCAQTEITLSHFAQCTQRRSQPQALTRRPGWWYPCCVFSRCGRMGTISPNCERLPDRATGGSHVPHSIPHPPQFQR